MYDDVKFLSSFLESLHDSSAACSGMFTNHSIVVCFSVFLWAIPQSLPRVITFVSVPVCGDAGTFCFRNYCCASVCPTCLSAWIGDHLSVVSLVVKSTTTRFIESLLTILVNVVSCTMLGSSCEKPRQLLNTGTNKDTRNTTVPCRGGTCCSRLNLLYYRH